MAAGNDASPVWFITGCSTGLGRALAERVLQRGHRCVVTARNPAQIADIVARAGWSREDVRRFVWENARNDRAALQGRGSKPEWPAQWQDLDRLPVVPSPDRIWTVVAGAPGPQSMVVIPWGYAKAAWRPVASA